MQFIFFILYLALGAVQIMAYLFGIQLWLGVSSLFGIILFFIMAALPFGSTVAAGISFYGAYKGWSWPWWQAALLTFPFAIVGLGTTGLSAVLGLAGRGKRQ